MEFSLDILRNDEKLIFALRTLYAEHGYIAYQASRFEKHELYAANKAFLPSGEIITFTNGSGKLMALRPDVTLSIIKSIKDIEKINKLYYNESVYRTIDGELKEQMQVGLECIGEVDTAQEAEVLMLAKKSLDILGGGAKTRLDVSHSKTTAAMGQLEALDSAVKALGIKDGINIDFSVAGDVSYYTGIVFQGFIEGIPEKVIVGGRYDKLLHDFGKSGGAVGFAVHLDLIKHINTPKPDTDKTIGIALPKGRLGESAFDILSKAGYDCPDMSGDSRKLVFENVNKGIRFFWVKPSDVAIYVERGVADIGIIGKDTLLETHREVDELLDLGLGKCRLCVAAKKDFDYTGISNSLRVATKFPNIAREHFANRGIDIDVIELHGSIELAPLLGLSDVIVDLVETGKTLKDNNMEVIEEITDISARLIANKASNKFNYDKISALSRNIENLCGRDD